MQDIYCGQCGLENLRTEVSRGFDINTGEPLFAWMIKCPKARLGFWSLLLESDSSRHTWTHTYNYHKRT